ncbi:MAG: YggS family pyridoxal phosphate-dependent enzyme, partial [Chthoniobacterales bacterium]
CTGNSPPPATGTVTTAGAGRTRLMAGTGSLAFHDAMRTRPLFFSFFHSIDSTALAQAIDRIAGETGKPVEGLLEVNVSGEETKHGFTPDDLRREFAALAKLSHLRIRGLMTMAPYSDNPEDARPVFRALRELRDELQSAHGHPLPELSMGMSGDFEPAIEEGATLVRVGSSIFGERPQQNEK